MTALDALGRSLAEGWWMLFDTLWALVLGFALSGMVQAFVPTHRLQRLLGGHRPAALARAGVLGAASSSCSYAASALAKALFAGGADFTASMVFMFASTNLVAELGIVLWQLIGWQFAAAEAVGGVIMIVLLGLVLPRAMPVRFLEAARVRLAASAAGEPASAVGPRASARTLRGWSEAASRAVGDLTMLRRELVLGFVVAGLLAELVPAWVWQSLFVTGHGFSSSLENAVLGPLLAIVSFVCSVGNVALAAALWSGGIGFGGTVAFVFADLLSVPLLLIYRKYYGVPVTVRLVAVFWAVVTVSGLATEYLFRAAGLVPASHPAVVAGTHAGANATTVLDALAVGVLAVLVLLHRARGRLGVSRLATDPVCGMQVDTARPGAVDGPPGARIYFCSDRCRHRFEAGRRGVGGLQVPRGAG